jgi:multidrug efflux pump subunit AcrB
VNAIVAWFVKNPIAANLAMVMIVVGGLTTIPDIDKQFFPERELNQIEVQVVYPGAGPAEVEQQIAMRIEEAVDDLDGIDDLYSYSTEGLGRVVIDVNTHYDSQRLLNNVKSRVDAINTFPVAAERARINELSWRSRIISLAIAGDIGEANLKELAEQVREELTALPYVAQVDLRGTRDYELSIEVSELHLRRYGLTFNDVAQAVRSSSMNMPAGKIKAEGGDIQLQTRTQAYKTADFERIVLLKNLDGAQVLLGDVATVKDGFAEIDANSRFNDKPSFAYDVFMTTERDILKGTEAVHQYLADKQAYLPPGVELTQWRDMSVPFMGRVSTLVTNGLGGLLLVFGVLMLFLRPRLAFWTCVGIAIAFLGALWALPATGASLNMITLFAFILILGIIVDDAIIVSESVYTHQQRLGNGIQGAIAGTQRVLKPVWFAVLSTMFFFGAFFFLPDEHTPPINIAKVVVLALAFSLIESMFILPSHLAHMKKQGTSRIAFLQKLEAVRAKFADKLLWFAQYKYRPMLERCIEWRGLTLAVFVMAWLVIFSIYKAGWMKTSFFPIVPADYMVTTVTLPEGIAFREVVVTMDQVEDAAEQLKQRYSQNGFPNMVGHIEAAAYNNTVRVSLALDSSEERPVSARQLKSEWQQLIGALPQAEEYDTRYTIIPVGKAIEFLITADNIEELRAVSRDMSASLNRYPGIYNVRDTLENPRPEIELSLKPEAETLNLSLADVANQVRRGFYGEEVQRIPRLREDVKVMVRYPLSERLSEDALRDMRIRTPDGIEVPFEVVADINYVPSYREIERKNRKRVATITAEMQKGSGNAVEIINAIKAENFADWKARYPSVSILTEGEEQDRTEFQRAVVKLLLLAMLLVFGMMAIAFHSYWQPLLVLSAIPFGLMGAIIGHLVMDLEISMLSMIGFVAAAGVVVNDNLVLLDRINTLRAEGEKLAAAVVQGAQDRFRAIILTSVTTFVGLTPIMLETSVQSKFLIPMVVSLSFGVLLATFVTLIFVPVLYLSGSNIKRRLGHFFQELIGGKSVAQIEVE